MRLHRAGASGESAATVESASVVLPKPLIVGMGASAGGLEAFKTFFSHMPADTDMAFVLVQHLAPQHSSMLVELLGRHTQMPVIEAVDGARVEARHVYVIPPDATLRIGDGALQVSRPAPPRQYRWPIDAFFTSLAEDQGDCAICVVLSGTGSDGSRGLRAVKEHGGLALAQAGFDHIAMSGMPASAAATGQVDDVLPVEAMPARLIAHHQHLQSMHAHKGADGARQDLLAHLKTITGLLRAEVGHDFSQYKDKTLVRRIQRRMQVLQCETVPDYIALLRQDSRESEALFRELLISVTEFFRDPAAFAALQTAAIPALLASKGAADVVRVWVPGCATGEEAYSIAIALKEAIGEGRGAPKVQIFATDIDDAAIAIARAGRYRKPQPGLSPERQARWFTDDGDSLCVVKSIRELCIFSPHSAIKDPPFSQLDLVSCRNLLIYMTPELQERLVRTFHYALKPGGFLLLGPSEGLGRNPTLFEPLDKKHRLYARRNDGKAGLPPVAPNRRGDHPADALADGPSRLVAAAHRPGAEDVLARTARRALEKYAPAYVVIDTHHDVLRFSGDTGRYLGPSSGAASLNLFTLLHKGLRGAARAAVQQAFAEQRTVVQEGLTVTVDGQRQPLRLIAEPLPDGDGSAHLCAVAFVDIIERAPRTGGAGAADDASGPAHLQQLEQELETTRVQLHSSIDQLETANEEMKSANEEYQSVNEELQSANEELETSKEEMQSINEELQTVNAELHSKNDTLLHVNSDLQNLLESTQIATLFLDTRLHVTNFTPAVAELFHLRDSDRGRPITDINARIQYPELQHDVMQVMRTLAVVERELRSDTGSVFLLRMRPYRTVDNVIDGVVLSFLDISERKQQEFERGQLAAIVDSSRDAIIGHRLDGTITSWNTAAEFLSGYPAGKVLGKPMSLLLPAQAASQMTDLLNTCVKQQRSAESEMVWQRQDGTLREVALTCSPVKDASGRVISGSTIARDISERAHIAHALREGEHRLAAVIDQAEVGVAEVDGDGRFLMANPRYCQIVGRPWEELSGLRVSDITHPDDQAATATLLKALVTDGTPRQIDKRHLRPDGSTGWSNIRVSSVLDQNGERRILAAVLDTTQRTRAAQHRELMLSELNHRVKNSLASVQAIALQTLAGVSSLDAFKTAFMARLLALSNTHNLLAEDAWRGVGLHQIVRNELAPYQHEGAQRAEIVGEPLQLTSKTALALGMTLHELTTNAIKHGALSVPEGGVAVHWTTRDVDGQPWLRLHWREHDGPPVVPPQRRGFGSRLIADGLSYELDGEVTLEFDPAGIVCTIDIPLPAPESESERLPEQPA